MYNSITTSNKAEITRNEIFGQVNNTSTTRPISPGVSGTEYPVKLYGTSPSLSWTGSQNSGPGPGLGWIGSRILRPGPVSKSDTQLFCGHFYCLMPNWPEPCTWSQSGDWEAPNWGRKELGVRDDWDLQSAKQRRVKEEEEAAN